ncbi:MAG: rhodanese-like domain-containing protein [Candidatus Krumholzibacteria bacterium]|nr:rhodanese-like domain-containing protein [Candidatus Krumholzibacteria bacterium]
MFGKVRHFLFLMVVLAVFVTGCSEDTTLPVDSGSILRDYMASENLDLDDMLIEWIIAASSVYPNQDNYYIMDLRSAEDFSLGRIENSVNTTLGTVVADAAANTQEKPILLVCYTGQSASHALVALRLSDYPDCQVLKFGFSSWTGDFDKWTANTANIGTGHENWSTDATAALVEYENPPITATATSGSGILAERVAAMTAGGFKGIPAATVLAAPGDYFINNYWAEADVTTYGHIAGAYRINPLTIEGAEFLNYDPEATVVTYCWTGQTSSVITAYLNVLGYNAISLKFGVNAMIFDALTGHFWPGSANYPIVSDS